MILKKLQRNLALLLAVLLAALSACGEPGAQSSPLPEGSASSGEGLPPDPDAEDEAPVERPFTLGVYTGVSFNPYFCENTLNQNVISLLFDPLVELDEQFAVQPCLATEVTVTVETTGGDEAEEPVTEGEEAESPEATQKTSVAATTVTVKLRTDVTFQDGSALTSSDVVYSLNQAKSASSIYSERLKRIKSVKAQGSGTVVIQVEGAAASFDRLLDIPIVKDGTGKRDVPTGTGAYRLRYDEDGSVSALEQNAAWWKGETLPLEEIPLYEAKDSDYLLYGFGGGEVSLVTTDLTGSNSLGYSGNFQVADYPTTVMLYLGCNTATGACASKSVRSAIYYALDRETLSNRLLSGHAQPTSLPISPDAAEYDAELAETLGQDIEKAQTLLSSGYKGKKLTLIVNADSEFKVAVAQEIQVELEALGMSVSVSRLSWSDFKEAVDNGAYDLYLGEVKLTADFSLDAFLNQDGALNPSGYAEEELAALYETFCQTGGEPHLDAAKKLYQALADEAPFIPLCFKRYSVLYQWNTLTSLTPTQQNLFYNFSGWRFVSDGDGEAKETEE